MQIKKHRERSKSSVELPKNDDKLKLIEKKQYAESIDNTYKNSFLEKAINITVSVVDNKALSGKEDTELVISDLDGAVDEKDDENSSTPSIPISSCSAGGSGSFIQMKNTLREKNQISHNQDNATPSYLLLMQYLDNPEKESKETDRVENIKEKYSSHHNLLGHLVILLNKYRIKTILSMIL